jgi:hypothetical protein
VPIPTKVMSWNPVHGKVYSMQHYVIKFVIDLPQVWFGLVWFMVFFNATFNNMSVISWRSVLFVKETGVSQEFASGKIIILFKLKTEKQKTYMFEKVSYLRLCWTVLVVHLSDCGPWSWLYGSWIYNYLCNQCLSPLKLNGCLLNIVIQWLIKVLKRVLLLLLNGIIRIKYEYVWVYRCINSASRSQTVHSVICTLISLWVTWPMFTFRY